MERQYLIIPQIDELEQSFALAKEYDAAFEYNDFFDPLVYGQEEEWRKRVEIYKGLPRDRSKDTLHGVFLDIAFTSKDTKIREYSRKLMKQSMSIAEKLGVKGVVFHSGLIGSLNTPAYLNGWLQEAERFYRELAMEFSGTEIYLENTFERSPETLVRLKERMADVDNFFLCLDYGHACLTPTDIQLWVEAFRGKTGHIHLNDNDLVDDLHEVPGEGKIDFIQCKKELGQLEGVSVLLELTGIEKQKRALTYMKNL
ncbi:MAG: sugar phosphate isomerase/epimerase [Lachnospiraceae bacterium]|nr:sugar phosphate isomerase/epimerase [Lachnospiraceae bacterium]